MTFKKEKMVWKKAYFIAILTIILFAGMVFAGFELGDANYSIVKTYGPSGNISGWLNISLDQEASTSIFSDSTENSITILDLLKQERNNNYAYSCDPTDCFSDYSASSITQSKTINLTAGEAALVGMKITGEDISIGSIDFVLQSDALANCSSQIKIDFLNDEKIEYINTKVSDSGSCSDLKKYGCYEIGGEKETYNLREGYTFCQKIELSESPGFNLGAWVGKISGEGELTMSLHTTYGQELENCVLPEITSEGEYSCNVNYSVPETGDYSVCIYMSSGSGAFTIKGDSAGEKCGFFGEPPKTYTAAYQIFAEGKSFGPVGDLNVSDSLGTGETLGTLASDYIISRYGRADCADGCVIPMKIISGTDQQITLKDLEFAYQKSAGPVTERNFYTLLETPAKISSDFQKLYLDDSEFSVPDYIGDYNFRLSLRGGLILSEDLSVGDLSEIVSLNPTSTASAFHTPFEVGVNVPKNVSITKYYWDFGDDKTDITSTNKTKHTYAATGVYELTVTITDSNGFSSSRIFDVIVNLPRDLINETLNKTKTNLANIETQFSGFDFFVQTGIKSVLRLNESEAALNSLETAFGSATSEEEYNSIITDLLELEIPSSISQTMIANLVPFFPDRSDIDMKVLEGIGGGGFLLEREDDYLDAILFWNDQNLNTKIDFVEYSGDFGDITLPILRFFTIKIQEKKDVGHSYFLIVPELNDLGFEVSALERKSGGYFYVDLEDGGVVQFYTTSDVDFSNLPAFISPAISRLSIAEITEPEKNDKGLIIVLILVALVIAGIVAYLVLQTWYKKRYESHLFENKNDLYNMANYVNRSKRKGLTKSETSRHLKGSGWTSEQVRYIMKKYAGKRTGMFELPVDKIMKKAKKRRDKPDY